MTLQNRLRESAKELARLLDEDMKQREADEAIKVDIAHSGRLCPEVVKDDGAVTSDTLLSIASRVDRYLEKYSARDALRILDICKILTTKRYSAIS